MYMEQVVEKIHPLVTLSGGIELFAALITLVLLIGFFCSISRKTLIGRSMIVVLLSHMVMQTSDGLLWFLVDNPKYIPLVKLLNITSNVSWWVLMTAYTYCIVYYISERKSISIKIAHGMAFLNGIIAFLFLLNFNGMFYYFDEEGVYCNGPYLWIHKLLWFFVLILNIIIIVYNRRQLKMIELLGFLSYSVFMIIAIQFEAMWDVTPMYIASMVSILWVCIQIYINQSRELQKKEQELSKQKIAIMLSQIQPHFLYNALLVIQELCITNPKEAEHATMEFSKFLRGNLDSLAADVPIPFVKEMEHTKNYLSLEQKRFGKKLQVQWDIQTTAFFIPALSLQPIVENAVRYGVTKIKGGGTVKIATKETEEQYVVTVSDNGKGFDPCQKKEDGRTHIGISNVAKRLEDMCNGRLEIESRENIGTIARLMIPKGGK